jgi:(p)ppGpp synthase/HD superfamily hydrolase
MLEALAFCKTHERDYICRFASFHDPHGSRTYSFTHSSSLEMLVSQHEDYDCLTIRLAERIHTMRELKQHPIEDIATMNGTNKMKILN